MRKLKTILIQNKRISNTDETDIQLEVNFKIRNSQNNNNFRQLLSQKVVKT